MYQRVSRRHARIEFMGVARHSAIEGSDHASDFRIQANLPGGPEYTVGKSTGFRQDAYLCTEEHYSIIPHRQFLFWHILYQKGPCALVTYCRQRTRKSHVLHGAWNAIQ